MAFLAHDFCHMNYPDIQRVQIVDSVDHGRMLVLDGFVNIAESDTSAYTHKLMGLPEVSRQTAMKKLLSDYVINEIIFFYSLHQSIRDPAS